MLHRHRHIYPQNNLMEENDQCYLSWRTRAIKFKYMKKAGCLLPVILFAVQFSLAQSGFATWTFTELTLTNGKVLRTIQLPGKAGKFLTTIYKPVDGEFYYFKNNNTDFQFEVNNIVYSGRTPWKLIRIESLADSKSGDGAAVTLLSGDNKIQLTIHYLLYPGLPVIRKSLVIKNLSKESIKLESVDIEKFEVTEFSASTYSWVCHDY